MTLQFVIFAFNRGRFLEHCVTSIEQCAPQCPVIIFDDNSDDPETRDILEKLGKRYEIQKPRARDRDSKHGGLYGNMEAALARLDDDSLMCSLQDDMQLVRPVSDSEIESFAALLNTKPLDNKSLNNTPGRGFLHHAFMKGAERENTRVTYDAAEDVYYTERPGSSAGQYYSDIFIAHVGHLRQADWHFQAREAANERQARNLFAPMLRLRDPFVAWLPSATAWRGKRRTWALRQGEKRHRCGFHPLHIMTEEQHASFTDRDPLLSLPFAEDWLSLKGERLPEPWIYHPLQNSRWLKWLNSAELKLRK